MGCGPPAPPTPPSYLQPKKETPKLESAFQLFPLHEHLPKWKRANAVEPQLCPGKDPEDTKCTCSDTMYSTRIRVFTGETVESRFYCGCCNLAIFPSSAPGGASTRPADAAREA